MPPQPAAPGQPFPSNSPLAPLDQFPTAPPVGSQAGASPIGNYPLDQGPPPGAPLRQPLPGPSSGLPPGFIASPRPGELSPQSILPLSASPNRSSVDAMDPNPRSAKPRRRLRWPGIVFPLLFLILAAIMVYLVLDLSELLPGSRARHEVPDAPAESAPSGTPNSEARRRATRPVENTPIARTSFTTQRPPVSIPEMTEPASAPDLVPDEPDLPLIDDRDINVEGQVPVAPLIDLNKPGAARPSSPATTEAPGPDEQPRKTASSVLDQFLAARSLEERLPFLAESWRSDTVLAGSALAKPLPEVVLRRPIHYVEDASDKHTEHFFEVSFLKSAERLPSPILVQLNEWSDGRIRVHTDAFLDLFNEELTVFGRAPVESERTFHVVADAYKSCFDDHIPDASGKAFIKLRPHPRITPRLRAYFSKDGLLADQISKSDGLRWGSSDVCTLTVRWNTDTPNQPYVELVRIDGFSTWNP